MRTVLRHQLSRKPFVTVANEVARDARLSYAARGVLIAMLSRPTNWQFSAERLAEGSPRDGRRLVLRCMKELETCGYLFRHRERDRATGQIRMVNIVSDEPIDDWESALGTGVRLGDSGQTGNVQVGTGVRLPDDGYPHDGEAHSYRNPENETQKRNPDPSIPLAGQDQERRNPDSAAPASAPTGVAGDELDLAEMDGWRRDRRRRKPWAELQARYDAGEIDDTDALAKLGELLGDGLDPAEERTAEGMLANGSHLKAVYNKIRADRRSP